MFTNININSARANCEQVWNIVLLFFLLTMNIYLPKNLQTGAKQA